MSASIHREAIAMTSLRLTEHHIVRKLLKKAPAKPRSLRPKAVASHTVRCVALLASVMLLGSIAPGVLWLVLIAALLLSLGWP